MHSAISMEDTELLSIKKIDFDNLLRAYPEIENELKVIALQRYDRNKTAVKIARTAGFKINNRYIYYNNYTN